MIPLYDLNKIKFATDGSTFKRAVGLYESGKVTKVEALGGYYSAIVIGTEAYQVSVSARNYKQGNCTCYVGQNDRLCKHMVALALHVVMDGRPLSEKDKQLSSEIKCSGRGNALNQNKIAAVKKSISESMKYIKPYSGPSRTWFANQDSLREGLTFKQIALVLKVPQYRLKYIESCGVKYINTDILENYVDYLELRKWFNLWKSHNVDVYNRLQGEK